MKNWIFPAVMLVAAALTGGFAFGASTSVNIPINVNAMTITSVSLSPANFVAQPGDANLAVGTLSTTVSSGNFNGSYGLAAAGSCTGLNDANFTKIRHQHRCRRFRHRLRRPLFALCDRYRPKFLQ